MAAIISLLIAVLLSITITRIATIILTHTGLSRQAASFQARSAFTGVGYTTRESEKIVNHPIRRRVLVILMLLGNAGVVTVVSSLVLTFVGVEDESNVLARVVVLALGITALWLLATSDWLNRKFEALVRAALHRFSRVQTYDYESLLHLSGDYSVSELKVENADWIAGRTLAEASLREEGIMVLGIVRANGTYRGAPDGDTHIRPDDMLLLYGRTTAIEHLDERTAGSGGDTDHQAMVAEQQRIRETEARSDPGNGA